MNKARRLALSNVTTQLAILCDDMENIDSVSAAIWNEMDKKIIKLKDQTQRILFDEEESFNNRSEGSQQTESGQESEAAIEIMYEAIDYMEDSIKWLTKAKQASTSRTRKKYQDESYNAIITAYDTLSEIDI